MFSMVKYNLLFAYSHLNGIRFYFITKTFFSFLIRAVKTFQFFLTLFYLHLWHNWSTIHWSIYIHMINSFKLRYQLLYIISIVVFNRGDLHTTRVLLNAWKKKRGILSFTCISQRICSMKGKKFNPCTTFHQKTCFKWNFWLILTKKGE